MNGRCERRDVLKALLASSAYSLLGVSGPARTQASEATLILRNGKITTLERVGIEAIAPWCRSISGSAC